MKRTLLLLLTLSPFLNIVAQEEKLDIDGALILGHTANPTPEPGTIRWTGSDFEGWNGESWVSLTGGKTGPVVDIDGNTYSTLKIGNQVWMTENLRTSKYRNGTVIPNVVSPTAWIGLSSAAYCWYDNDDVLYEDIYGKLYNWFAVDGDSLCPVGWHVPSHAEWTTLSDFVTNNGFGYQGSGPDIAKSLASTTNWTFSATAGDVGNDPLSNNSSGFSGAPAGERGHAVGDFFDVGAATFWWSKTEHTTTTKAWYRSLFFQSELFGMAEIDKNWGLSVRCLKD